jgi:glycosyltransferase involved in cell wall biosynthesis
VKVGFDAKRLYNNFTGLGNYSRFVVSSLLNEYPDDKYYLFTPKLRKNDDTKLFLEHPKVKTIQPPGWMTMLKLGSYWRSFNAGNAAADYGVEVYHGLSHELPRVPDSVKTVVTIHDLIFLRYPEFYNPIDVKIYTTKVNHACRNADRIIAISEQTSKDIQEFLKISPKKIDVVFQGCHPNFKSVFSVEQRKEVIDRYKIPSDYILNVGTIEERKNAVLIVKALARLPESSRLPIVIVGRETVYKDQIVKVARELGVEKYLVFVHDVKFEDLPAIYQGAKVFVYPSLFEGFGIPLIEAIESKVPVITSKESCFSEAAGPDSIYVDSSNVDELATQLERVLADQQLVNTMTQRSTQFITRFQPQIIARGIHAVYEKVLAKQP